MRAFLVWLAVCAVAGLNYGMAAVAALVGWWGDVALLLALGTSVLLVFALWVSGEPCCDHD